MINFLSIQCMKPVKQGHMENKFFSSRLFNSRILELQGKIHLSFPNFRYLIKFEWMHAQLVHEILRQKLIYSNDRKQRAIKCKYFGLFQDCRKGAAENCVLACSVLALHSIIHSQHH